MHTYFCVNYSFHNKLKMNPRYLNHHVNRHFDDLIGLLAIEVDLFYDRMRKEIMMATQDASIKVHRWRGKRYSLGRNPRFTCKGYA